jgi:hypothetical protein
MLDRLGSASINNILAGKNDGIVCVLQCVKLQCHTCCRIAANKDEFWEHSNETCGYAYLIEVFL